MAHTIYPIDEDGNIRIRPIGVVRSLVKEQQTGGFADAESEIVLDGQFEPMLHGFEEFSHAIVLFWLREIVAYTPQRRPQGREDVPVLGILATR